MKIYISADIEGVAGVSSWSQLWPGKFEYETARQWMTNEVLAAMRGAEKAGVTEFLVSDSHGVGENLLLDQFPSNVEVVRSWPRPHQMMQGIEEGGFIGALLIGYHTGASWASGVMAHTLSGAYHAIRINGVDVNEAYLCAGLAGHFDAPVLAVSGDSDLAEEIESFLPEVEKIITKKSYGFTSIKTPPPEVTCNLIEERVEKSVRRRGEIKPFMAPAPLELEIEFRDRIRAEVVNLLPFAERTGACKVILKPSDITEAVRYLEFFTNYGRDRQ